MRSGFPTTLSPHSHPHPNHSPKPRTLTLTSNPSLNPHLRRLPAYRPTLRPPLLSPLPLLDALKTPKPIPLRALELGGNPRIKAETLAAIRARLGAPSDATPFDDADDPRGVKATMVRSNSFSRISIYGGDGDRNSLASLASRHTTDLTVAPNLSYVDARHPAPSHSCRRLAPVAVRRGLPPLLRDVRAVDLPRRLASHPRLGLPPERVQAEGRHDRRGASVRAAVPSATDIASLCSVRPTVRLLAVPRMMMFER